LVADKREASMAYLREEEQRQRIIALVRKKTGIDCPTLEVEDIQNPLGSVRVFYWCREEDVGEREHLKHITLTDEEAESISINRTRTPRGRPETGGPSRGG
jgi:hypothetical protein